MHIYHFIKINTVNESIQANICCRNKELEKALIVIFCYFCFSKISAFIKTIIIHWQTTQLCDNKDMFEVTDMAWKNQT